MKSSTSLNVYVGSLFVVGLAMVVWGTFMPLGGGSALVSLGAAAVGAGLVLVGLRILDQRQ